MMLHDVMAMAKDLRDKQTRLREMLAQPDMDPDRRARLESLAAQLDEMAAVFPTEQRIADRLGWPVEVLRQRLVLLDARQTGEHGTH